MKNLSAARKAYVVTIAVVAGLTLGLALGVAAAGLIGLSVRADDVERLAGEIQKSRVDSVLISCREQNKRHDSSIHALDQILDKARRDAPAERRAQIEQSRVSTIYLIDSLVPKRDCPARAAALAELD